MTRAPCKGGSISPAGAGGRRTYQLISTRGTVNRPSFVVCSIVSFDTQSTAVEHPLADAIESHIAVHSPATLKSNNMSSRITYTLPNGHVPSAISSRLPSSCSSTTIVKDFLSILTTNAASPLKRLKRNFRIASCVAAGRSTEFVDWGAGLVEYDERGGRNLAIVGRRVTEMSTRTTTMKRWSCFM